MKPVFHLAILLERSDFFLCWHRVCGRDKQLMTNVQGIEKVASHEEIRLVENMLTVADNLGGTQL
jgi:hypothetical protein